LGIYSADPAIPDRAGAESLFVPTFGVAWQEDAMKKLMPLYLLIISASVQSCAPIATAASTVPPATESVAPVETQTPITETVASTEAQTPITPTVASTKTKTPVTASPTDADPYLPWKIYTNGEFGFSFQYPPDWFGPDEYISERTLRVSVGSDIVYPYGTGRDERIYLLRNSYYVDIQYSKNIQNPYWNDTYKTLGRMQDGESVADMRSLIIRVRELESGRFKGFEYISTLSETAQTEYFYAREIMLYDETSYDLLTVMGYPNNVEIDDAAEWREAYQRIDEANLMLFRAIIESIMIE
jgi:hypothetical protein